MGHESAGVVEAVGSEVTYVKPGDHVVACQGYCGTCTPCLTGRTHWCQHRPSLRRSPSDTPRLRDRAGSPLVPYADLATFAELMLVHESSVVKVPVEVPFPQASLVSCGVMTGAGAVFNTARVRPGQSVAVIGCGGIGLNVIQAAVISGASPVVAIDRLASKLQRALDFGATDVVDASTVDPVSAVRDLTHGGADHAFEVVGNKSTVEQAWDMLGLQGTATVVGALPTGTTLEISGDAMLTERRLQGCFLGSGRYRVDMPMLFGMYLDGRLNLDDLVSAEIALDDVNAGYDRLLAGDVARSVITFDA
jgi:S-(hydroxymethyl)glutathione dehydrogenase/alcohol dehydrogenase